MSSLSSLSSTAPALPADIQQVLDEIDDSDRAADALVATLSDAQFHWQPDGGRSWSIAQCLEHLATINVVYGGAVREGIELARQQGWARSGELKPGFFGQKFIESQEPPVKRRVRAPGTVRPGSQLTRDEILRRYHAAHEDVKRLIRNAATIDANRATFPNPFLKIVRVKVATGLRVIAAHDRRHLWQAEQVLKRPDFPR
jgi:hypothetical protein